MKAKITIKDIAKELGVSTSTVSRALNDSPEIGEETRKKIKAFADLYHYKPNMLALKLRNNKTMVIGVIIPEIVHHFFSQVISGIEKIANGRDYNVMICLSNESYEKEKLNMKMMANGSVDGLLVSISKETLEIGDFSHFNALDDYNIPLVLFDRVSAEIDCDQVVVDDVGGAYKATQHLLDVGCQDIVILTTPDHVTVGALRTKGFMKALEDNKRAYSERDVLKISDKEDSTAQIMQFLFEREQLPDAIVAVNEIYGAIAMKVCKERGYQIPEEVSVICFTDGLISAFSSPAMSTVAQHGITMGEQAAELLLDRILKKNGEAKNYEKKVISTDLKLRESTKKLTRSIEVK